MIIKTDVLLESISKDIEMLYELLNKKDSEYSEKINSKRRFWKGLVSFGLWKHVDKKYVLPKDSSTYHVWSEMLLKEFKKYDMVKLAYKSGYEEFDTSNFKNL